ncbi:MAG: MBL fold metallo-hydrolase [Lamprobacter sp.]|uniref:MBL fold metallo-hydrolase n=1 Tax=Lamprobacter sp. TaxID=3100796 RepID=UPI002B25A723|nr:MBL fold metallo-hydrolase [Lamprobacter sp.]MEA3639058.1 MBL fold metallo-hydrolase [Lamprobacter sp.]
MLPPGYQENTGVNARLETHLETYSAPPSALFITHAHFDHIGSLEGLYYREC